MANAKEKVEFDIEIGGADDNSNKILGDFSKSEIERTRRFAYSKRANAPQVGHIDGMHLFVKYDRNSGTAEIQFTEHTGPFRITGGTTRLGLIDQNGTIIAEWDFPMFRDCGTHNRTFSGQISRFVAEQVTGLSFRTIGNVPAQRC